MIKTGAKLLMPFLALTAGCRSPESRSLSFLQSRQHPSLEVRNVSEPRSGLICGEVRWVALDGDYGSWWPFHIRDGKSEIGEDYTEIWDPNYGKPTAFDRAHVECKSIS